MNGYEEKIKDRLFLEVCNAAGREEWDGLAHQQKETSCWYAVSAGMTKSFRGTEDLSPESRWSIGG